jgi:hypothetical protein
MILIATVESQLARILKRTVARSATADAGG